MMLVEGQGVMLVLHRQLVVIDTTGPSLSSIFLRTGLGSYSGHTWQAGLLGLLGSSWHSSAWGTHKGG